MRVPVLIPLMLIFAISGQALADASTEAAQSGKMAWSGFECSVLASMIGRQDDAKWLFEFAMEQGTRFVDAVKAGEVSKEDMDAEVPMAVLWVLEGPSTDFVLGRMYESASDYASDKLRNEDNSIAQNDVRETRAENRYHERNCALLGKSSSE